MSNKVTDLKDREFLGRIIPKGSPKEYDEKMKGRYKVHIPNLMPHLEEEKGIWCKNHVSKWHITDSDVGEYGSHFPLQAGTYVIVKFFENDYNTAYIDRIVSDYEDERDVEAQDCVKVKPALTDRDEQYIIFKTPKKWNSLYINEETTNEPNTIYLIYNRDNAPERRTVYRINESGIHIYTRDNIRIRVLEDENVEIDGNKSLYLKGDKRQNIIGNVDSDIEGDTTSRMQGFYDYTLIGDKKRIIKGNYDETLDGNKIVKYNSNLDFTLEGNNKRIIKGDYSDTLDGDKKSIIKGYSHNTIDGDKIVKYNAYLDVTLDGTKTELLKSDYHESIIGDQFTKYTSNVDTTILGNKLELIDGNYHRTINGNQVFLTQQNLNFMINNNYLKQIANDSKICIDSNNHLTVGGNNYTKVEGDSNNIIDGNSKLSIGGDLHIKLDGDLKFDLGFMTFMVDYKEEEIQIYTPYKIKIKCKSFAANISQDVDPAIPSLPSSPSSCSLNSPDIPIGPMLPLNPSDPELPEEPQEPELPDPKIEVIDLGPNETAEYNTGVGDKCDDRTDDYNNKQRDFVLSMFKK